MTEYSAILRMVDEAGPGLPVHIDLTGGHLRISTDAVEIGDWPLDAVHLEAREDEIRLMAEGDIISLVLDDDAAFAVEAGLRSAPPLLRRRMAAILREKSAFDGPDPAISRPETASARSDSPSESP